jgi:aspartyl protease family protein
MKTSEAYRMLALLLVSSLGAADASAQQVRYMVFDGNKYRADQLELSARSPVLRQSAYVDTNGALVVPRAANGHYYVAGSVNGFPVVFLVDTGATHTSLPSRIIRNVGIRSGLVQVFSTAAGNVEGTVSKGNLVTFGPFKVRNADIAANDKLSEPLLGMGVLRQFQFVQSQDVLVIRGAR